MICVMNPYDVPEDAIVVNSTPAEAEFNGEMIVAMSTTKNNLSFSEGTRFITVFLHLH